jgi:Cys-rich protein (TIGR01571 family)
MVFGGIMLFLACLFDFGSHLETATVQYQINRGSQTPVQCSSSEYSWAWLLQTEPIQQAKSTESIRKLFKTQSLASAPAPAPGPVAAPAPDPASAPSSGSASAPAGVPSGTVTTSTGVQISGANLTTYFKCRSKGMGLGDLITSIVGLIMCVMGVWLRKSVREKSGIPGNVGMDALLVCCCPCCSLAQVGAEVDINALQKIDACSCHGEEPAGGYKPYSTIASTPQSGPQ